MPHHPPRTWENVFCSAREGSAFARELTAAGDVVTITRIETLTPTLTLQEILATGPEKLTRHYRGPLVTAEGVSAACPFCGNARIHECASCRLLICSAADIPQTCMICGHTGPGVPQGDPTLPAVLLPEPYTLGGRIHDLLVRLQESIADRRHSRVMEELERLRHRPKDP